MRFTLLAVAVSLCCLPAMVAEAQPGAGPHLIAPRQIIAGDPTGLSVEGATPGEVVRVHVLRRTATVSFENNQRAERPVITHAWADYRANGSGRVVLDTAVSIAGTYAGVDPNGLLWSGWPLGDERIGGGRHPEIGAEPTVPAGQLVIRVERAGVLGAATLVPVRAYSDRVRFTELTVAADGASGVFAAPDQATRLPGLILLHGSEGGSMTAARAWAGRMAERGFAALAVNYVAYSWSGGIPGVPGTFTNLPVELIDRARQWLATREEADAAKIALVGGSKGAELALVAASRYPWVRATVACVPSDIVWSGFGREAAPGELLSSWSWAGKPLPFVAYDRYEDVFSGRATAAAVHARSRAAAPPATLAASRIPVERIAGPVLLLGAGRDEVWPSLEMTTSIKRQYADARRDALLETAEFPQAEHGICGTGASPARADGKDGAETAKAAGAAFRRTLAFLRRVRQ